jgi:hypothetical protein
MYVLVMSCDMEKEENLAAPRSARHIFLPCRVIWEHRKKGSSLSERITAWANLPRHEVTIALSSSSLDLDPRSSLTLFAGKNGYTGAVRNTILRS